MSQFQRPTICICWFATLAVVGGCTLFDPETGLIPRLTDSFKSKADETGHASLPQLKSSIEAIQLEIIFVERPTGDPLLGTYLWQEVDQSGVLEPPVQKTIENAGFRIGVASSTPPQALQKLLGLRSGIPGENSAHRADQLIGHRVALLADGEQVVQTSPIHPFFTVDLERNGERTTEDFHNARCVFRVKIRRLQDGWSKLEFTPEIHHGKLQTRPTANEALQWQYRASQMIEPLYDQKFELTLNLHEMAVISCDGDVMNSLGRRFFIGADERAKTQRLLVVRFADMGPAAVRISKE